MVTDIDITVADLTGARGLRPVTGGIAIPKAMAGKGSRFGLQESSGTMVACQADVLGAWTDGSARWVLLDFQSDPPAKGNLHYKLSWSHSDRLPTPEMPVHVTAGTDFILESGSVRIRQAKNALFSVSDRVDVALTALDSEGRPCKAVAESVTVERSGDLRSTLRIDGALRGESGERFLGIRIWISVFAGLGKVKLEPMILADGDKGLVQKLRELKIEIKPRKPIESAVIGGQPGWTGKPRSGLRLFQVDDRQYRIEGAEGRGSKAPGWAEITSSGWRASVAIRDFWQQWPKSIEAEPGALSVALFPRFVAGTFDHMLNPWYKHDYLFEDDCYRLRSGQTRRWQVWLDLEGDGAALAACANQPLVPAANPSDAMATGLWGDILPAGVQEMADYDAWVSGLFDAYQAATEAERDYGAMNWGDWFGERGCNWGNHEYDTPRQFLVQFARTGDPKYLHAGDVAARHMSEVDVVHFINSDLRDYFEKETGKREGCITEPGLVHEHSVGHVGGFHTVQQIRDLYVKLRVGNTDRPYLCLDPYNLGHVFTDGMMYDYFLTGDPWLKETLDRIGSHLARLVEERKFQFMGHSHCGRENGWTMLALAACYEIGHSARFLNAMKMLADDALEEQDPNCGGWLYQLGHGHCDCVKKKHIGEAAFIGSIRLNGLYRYHRLTGDDRIPKCIQRGITHMNHDTWNENARGWRYTSCPRTYKSVSQNGVIIQAISNSVRLTDDSDQLAVLTKAWDCLFNRLKATKPTGRGSGKAFSSTVYGCPEAASLLAEKAKTSPPK